MVPIRRPSGVGAPAGPRLPRSAMDPVTVYATYATLGLGALERTHNVGHRAAQPAAARRAVRSGGVEAGPTGHEKRRPVRANVPAVSGIRARV